MSRPQASRSGTSSPYGKRSEAIKGKVSERVKLEIQRRCAATVMSESEWLSSYLEASLFGIEHAESIQKQRLQVVLGKGLE